MFILAGDSGGDAGGDAGGKGETFANGAAGTTEMLTSAGTGAGGVGALLAAAVVPFTGGRSAAPELGDSVTAGPGWPDA